MYPNCQSKAKPPIRIPKRIISEVSLHLGDSKFEKTSLKQSNMKIAAIGITADVIRYDVESLGSFIAMNNPNPKIKL